MHNDSDQKSELPRVSVLLPTYQQAHFIRATLDSVLVQNYPNLQVVVGDDASTDGTREILLEYDRKYPGVFKLLLHEVNQGVTANQNLILRECDGEFVAFFSGDDLWLPGKLHKQVAWFAAHPEAAICYTNTEAFDSDTGERIRLQHDARNPFRSGGAEQMLLSGTFFNGCSVMARRSMLPPGGYEPSLTVVSDWLLLLETAHNGRIGYIEEVLARYRLHSGNVSKRIDVLLREQLHALDIVESRYPEDVRYTKRLRADCVFGCGIEALKKGDVDTARQLLRDSLRVRLRGPSFAPFPLNVAVVLIARIGLLPLFWRGWRKLRRRLDDR
jgi:glycosyltransferase involved in cell wall biosynthesis